MRITFNSSILMDGDNFLGIDLGADFCAEHEWGISEIQNSFGINESLMGVDRYAITKNPADHMVRIKFTDRKKPYVGILFDVDYPMFYNENIPIKRHLPLPLKGTEDEICAAWDKKGFAIVVHKKNTWILDEICKAIENLDLTIGLGPSGPFNNGGLKLIIRSKIPEEMANSIMNEHLENKRLMDAVRATGIEEYLKKHGKKYHALAPEWYNPEFKPHDRSINTKYDVVFFLNPQKQSIYNYGWFTVEELQDWANDRGIIIKN